MSDIVYYLCLSKQPNTRNTFFFCTWRGWETGKAGTGVNEVLITKSIRVPSSATFTHFTKTPKLSASPEPSSLSLPFTMRSWSGIGLLGKHSSAILIWLERIIGLSRLNKGNWRVDDSVRAQHRRVPRLTELKHSNPSGVSKLLVSEPIHKR